MAKQKREAAHIEEGYKERRVSNDEAERRAWDTVNKESGGGNKSGSGRGGPTPRLRRARAAGLAARRSPRDPRPRVAKPP